MKTLYLILLGISIFLLVCDSIGTFERHASRRGAFTIQLQPLAIALAFLVWFIQIANT